MSIKGPYTSIIELALTLGRWGAAPLKPDDALTIAEKLAGWASRVKQPLRIEVYGESAGDRRVLKRLLELQRQGLSVTPVVRLEPRSDRWNVLKTLDVRHVVFDVPVAQESAAARFTPHGAERSPMFALEAARGAMLTGMTPEISLTDITRAEKSTVSATIRDIEREGHARNVAPLYRLVDKLGLANPLPEGGQLASLAGWVRWIERELDVPASRLSVQASDQKGLALANTLDGVRLGTGAAVSLFGLGMRTGWAATEQLLDHLDVPELNTLPGLLSLLSENGSRIDSRRPIAGNQAFEMLGGAAPEELHTRYEAQLGCDPVERYGVQPAPLLTALSGHAGMLHLMHRNYPDHHFDSDDPRSLQVSSEFEEEFDRGRQIPVHWSELEPKLAEKDLFRGKGSEE
jgi:hypothetical protein